MVVTVQDPYKGACTFTRQQPPQDELKVTIGGNNLPACPPGSPEVVGVGTHANRCRTSGTQADVQEMISGAVRDRNFTVVIASKSPLSPAKKDILQQVSEQVAGNLF